MICKVPFNPNHSIILCKIPRIIMKPGIIIKNILFCRIQELLADEAQCDTVHKKSDNCLQEKAISTNAPSCSSLVEIAFSQLCLLLIWINEAGSCSSL